MKSTGRIVTVTCLGLFIAALFGCGGGQQAQQKTDATGAGQQPAAQPQTKEGCRLEFRSRQVQALSLPTNVLVSAPQGTPAEGQCSLVLSGQDLIFPIPAESGNAEYTLTLKALELKRQSRIVTNGYRLTIIASSITSEGGQIFSFDQPRKARDAGSPGQNGENGNSGGNVIIIADTVVGTLFVDLRGQDGGDGGAGAPGTPGQRGASGGAAISGVFGCQQGGGNGAPGGDGGRGGHGGNGGAGGNGGNLTLKIKKSPERGSVWALDGGIGGRPGTGGAGGPGGQGGEGGGGNGFCGGGAPGPGGKPGPPGDPGLEGAKGIPGQPSIGVASAR